MRLGRQNTILLFTLYVTQYIGLAFFLEGLIAIYRKNGMPLDDLGMVYMLGLFWAIRFLWAGVIDRFSFKNIGHYRGWLLILQPLMVVSITINAFFDPIVDLWVVISLCALLSFLSASQSLAVDALAFKLVGKEERGFANSLKISGSMTGSILGGGVALVFYAVWGWATSMLVLGVTTAAAIIQLIFLKEPQIEEREANQGIGFGRFISFWKGGDKKRWLLLLVLYPISNAMAYGIATPLFVDIGWSLEKIGIIFNTLGAIISVVAALVSVWFIKKFGKKQVLIISSLIQGASILSIVVISNGIDVKYTPYFFALILLMLYSPMAVTLSTIMMDKISKAPAAEFAIQHSLYQSIGIILSAASMAMAHKIGYSTTAVIAVLSAIIASFAVYKLYNET